MTSVVVSFCKNRKISHNKAPVSRMGSCADGHPQGWLLGLSSSPGHLFFFFIHTVFTTDFIIRLSSMRGKCLLYVVFHRLKNILITKDSLVSNFQVTHSQPRLLLKVALSCACLTLAPYILLLRGFILRTIESPSFRTGMNFWHHSSPALLCDSFDEELLF